LYSGPPFKPEPSLVPVLFTSYLAPDLVKILLKNVKLEPGLKLELATPNAVASSAPFTVKLITSPA
jgi:hypothetical protein